MGTAQEKSQDTNAIRKEIALQDAIAANPGVCDDCKKPGLFWAKTVSGKSILMDPEVNPKGSWLVTPLFTKRLQARHLNQHDRKLYPNAVLRTCHFDSCERRERSTVVEAGRARQLRDAV